jgi:hypothetical protein
MISTTRRHRDFPEKSDECEFLFGLKLRVETKLLIGVIGVYRVIPHVTETLIEVINK